MLSSRIFRIGAVVAAITFFAGTAMAQPYIIPTRTR